MRDKIITYGVGTIFLIFVCFQVGRVAIPMYQPSNPIIFDSASAEIQGSYSTEVEDVNSVESRYKAHSLTKQAGVFYYGQQKETWYNLPMEGVINNMRNLGYVDEYWVREDGVKMLGDYVIVAANLDLHPKGSLIETSLGVGIVCDTGEFANYNSNQIDIAVDWR